MLSAIAEDLPVEFGDAVDDGGLLGEVVGGVDEAGDLDDADDPVEVPDDSRDRGQGVEAGGASQLVAGVDIDIRAQMSGGRQFSVDDGQLTGGVDVVAGSQRRDVGAGGGGDLGQIEAELGDAVKGFGYIFLSSTSCKGN